MLERGRTIGGIRLDEPLGDTALASAWRATELRRDVPLGVRILAPEAMPWADTFRAAVAAQRGLIHPNRLQVLGEIEVDGRPAAVTEQVAGPSLATWIRVRRRGPDEVLTVFEDVVRGIAAAHQHELLHLAVDAGSVWMQSRKGVFVPKVDLALGTVIAAAAAAGRRLDPARLPAPAPLDARADLYLLGTLLFEMLERRLPFEAADLVGPLRRSPRLGPGAPEDVQALVDWLLARRPTSRPASAEAVLAAMAPATPEPVPGPVAELGRSAVARPPVLVAAGVAAALIAAGSLVAWLG